MDDAKRIFVDKISYARINEVTLFPETLIGMGMNDIEPCRSESYR